MIKSNDFELLNFVLENILFLNSGNKGRTLIHVLNSRNKTIHKQLYLMHVRGMQLRTQFVKIFAIEGAVFK